MAVLIGGSFQEADCREVVFIERVKKSAISYW